MAVPVFKTKFAPLLSCWSRLGSSYSATQILLSDFSRPYRIAHFLFIFFFIYMNIYVSNLSFNVEDEDLREFFAEYGEVTSARVIMDKFTNKSRGFGFVEVASKDANKMIQKLNDFEFEGRTLKVREAKERQDNDDGEE